MKSEIHTLRDITKLRQGECLLYQAKPDLRLWAFCIDVVAAERFSFLHWGDAEYLSFPATSAYLRYGEDDPFTGSDGLQIYNAKNIYQWTFDSYWIFLYPDILELIDDLPVSIVVPNSELIRKLIDATQPRLSG